MAGRTPPPREFSWARTLRTLLFWALLIVGSIFLVQFASSRRQEAVELSYAPQFSEQLDKGNIAAVEITDRQQVKGDFRTPVTIGRHTAEHFTMLLPFESTDEWVNTLRTKGVDVRAREEKQSFGVFLFSFLPYLFIIGLLIFMVRQMQQGGNRAFAFGKSKAKLLSGDTPKVTFADVAGADEAKQELEEMFVGVGASRVRDLFEQGKAHAPCIIFIDEIDAVGRHRGAGLGGGHDEREQTLNQLLVEMDGFESNDGVILIAATNRPDVLDPALLRPGRFDRQVVVDLPDLRGREEILRVHLRRVPVSEDLDVSTIARGTPGMSGADLANLVNEAALLAARRNHERVFLSDMEEAKDKVMLGAERKSMVMKEDEKRNTAYHEAGHAVCAIKTPGCDPLHKVTIVPRGRALGLAFTLPTEDRYSVTRQQLEAMLVMTYGGRVAEEMIFGYEKVTTGAANDIQKATSLARRYVSQWGLSDAIGPVLVGDNEQEVFLGRELSHRREVSEKTAQLVDAEVARLLTDSYNRAKQTLETNADLLHAIAGALLERETLTAEDIEILVRGEKLPPRKISGPPPAPATPVPIPQAKPAKPPLLGGPEPAPA